MGHFTNEQTRRTFLERYDRLAARWPVPAEEIDVETTRGTTHVRRCGNPSGSPLVLIHPNLGTSLSWFRLVEPLAARHRVFALHTIGTAGRSVQTPRWRAARCGSGPGCPSSTPSAPWRPSSTSWHGTTTPTAMSSEPLW